MPPLHDSWPRLQEIFEAALALPVDARGPYLAKTCLGDEPLRQQVELLLASHQRTMDSAVTAVYRTLDETVIPKESTGNRIGPYLLGSRIGAGGMGEVFSAQDTRLKRRVAIKFLSRQMPGDLQARERFEREARAVAGLNHPHICTLYDIGSQDGNDYLVMEYIEGATLRGPMPVDEAIKVGTQIAAALATAHQHNILHRDLKPANVMVTSNGVKLLDFGLAKSMDPADDSNTAVGTVAGTAAYMSPEQARGEPLDVRSDIFSFGVVLYEMLSGNRAFAGSTMGQVLSAVLSYDPPPLPPSTLVPVIAKCLAKQPSQRFQTMAEVQAALEQPLSEQPCSIPVEEAPSIAVLPFASMSSDPENEYLSDGISEEIINALTQLPGLRVAARSSSFWFKGKSVELADIARRLNVRHVLEGTVRKSGSRVRVMAQLVDTSNGFQLASERYDREIADLFEVQDEIAHAIVERLKVAMDSGAAPGLVRKRLTRHHTENAEAYHLYLKGRHHWNQWTEDGFYKAIEYFQQAIEIDPGYALAYTGVADSYVLLGWNSYLPPREAFPHGKVAALTALRLDPDLAEAHTALAALLWLYDWRWTEAEAEFNRSLELCPTYPTANHWYAEYLMTMGRHDDAVARVKNSQELDPLSLIINVAVGWALYNGRRYEEAITQLRQVAELDPNYPVTYWILGLALRKTGSHDLAIVEGEKGVKTSGGSPLMQAALAHSLGAAGQTEEAHRLLDELTELSKQKYIAPYFFAGIHAGLNENERALDYLEKAYQERSHWLIYLQMDPSMDGLRDIPRFQDLLTRVRGGVRAESHSRLSTSRI